VGDVESAVAARNSLLVTAQGFGALAASILLSWFAHAKRKGLWMAAGQVAFGVAVLGLSFSRSLGLSAAFMVIAGWGSVTQNNNANQILQLTVPRAYRARVFSTYLFALQGVTPFGSLLAGAIAQYYGAPAFALMSGALCLAMAVGGNLFSSKLRDYRLEDPAA
jgi:MFS family permease